MTTEPQTTDITTLPPAERALIVLNTTKTEADLKAMVEESQAIVAVKDKAGREQAHRVGMRLKTARTTIEKTGKAAREDAQAFSRAVIEEEKRLKAITASEEERIFKLRDSYDAAVKAEEEARARAEEDRKADIRSKIDGIRRLPTDLAGESSELIQAEIDALAAFTPKEEVFGEFIDETRQALADALAAMRDLHDRVKGQEAAAALVEAERMRIAEIERQANERASAAEAEAAALRAQLAALQAQHIVMIKKSEPIISVESGSENEPSGMEISQDVASGLAEQAFAPIAEPTEFTGFAEPELTLHTNDATEPAFAQVSDFKIRRVALATADQFAALADKVAACSFDGFANELRAVAYGLREGDHDAKIAAADPAALIEADNRLLDATVNSVEAFDVEQQEKAA